MIPFERGNGDIAIAASGNRPDYGSGPYLALIAAMVRLARQDLDDPLHSEEAQAFLRGDAWGDLDVGIDIRLFADCIGYEGAWDA